MTTSASERQANLAAHAATGTRIDPPHALHRDAANSPAAPSARDDSQLATDSPVVARPASAEDGQEELRRQASQLQRHLSEQLGELNRREAALNALAADVENQARGARLWLRERHAELESRERALNEREQALAGRQPARVAKPAPHDGEQAIRARLSELRGEIAARYEKLVHYRRALAESRAAQQRLANSARPSIKT